MTERTAHEITTPSGSKFIAVSGAATYAGRPGYTTTKVKGHDDPRGRGFVVTKRS